MAVAALRMSDSGGRRKLNSSPDIPYKFLTTLIWAPAFPLLRLATSKLPHLRPYVIGGAIVAANLHGFWLIQNPDLSDEAIN